jgi:hypothetical protein
MAGDSAIERIVVRLLPDGRMCRTDAAKYLGLEPKTLAQWALRGKGPPILRVGSRCFYRRTDLDAFITNSTNPALSR